MPATIPLSSYPMLMNLINQTYLDRVEQISAAQVDDASNIIAVALDGRKKLVCKVTDSDIEVRLMGGDKAANSLKFAAPQKKKNCSKGISCGMTCIPASKTCKKPISPNQRAQKKKIVASVSPADLEDSKDEAIETSIDTPLQQIARIPTKFIKSRGKGDEVIAAALKESGRNVTPVFVRRNNEEDHAVLGNNAIAASSNRAGNDFTWTVPLNAKQAAQLKIEELGSGNDDTLKRSAKSTFSELGGSTGVISRMPLREVRGKGSADSETVNKIAEELRKTGRNVTPVFVRATGPGAYEVIGNSHIADAARKANLNFVWTIPLNDKQIEQLKIERNA
jgi:hypothetical protein